MKEPTDPFDDTSIPPINIPPIDKEELRRRFREGGRFSRETS